jgi:hypothetical protein
MTLCTYPFQENRPAVIPEAVVRRPQYTGVHDSDVYQLTSLV